MKLYTCPAPNPRVVELFLAEKGIKLERVSVNLGKREQRSSEHLARNPTGQVPVLELDDGFCLSQVVAICEYLEELYPEPSLIGKTPKERAETRMWTRRITLLFTEPLSNGFRYSDGLAFFETLVHCIPQAADDLKAIAQENLVSFEEQLQGRSFVCGDRFTLADILLYVFVDFGISVHQAVDPRALGL